MYNTDIFYDAIKKYPEIKEHLYKLAIRVAKTRILKGRIKLGENITPSAINGLLSLFPNTAINNKNNTVYIMLDKINIASVDAFSWITALCNACEVKIDTNENMKNVALKESALMLDRCRLEFPDISPVWDSEYLPGISVMAKNRTISVVQNEYFKLANIVIFLLSDHEPIGMADLSARFFSDSKTLKTSPQLVRKLTEWLLILRDEDINDDSRKRIWSDYDVTENSTAIKVTLFGPLIYYKNGECFDWIQKLYLKGETATLSWNNLYGIDSLLLPDDLSVFTCENETPFNLLIRENNKGLFIYTAGYPNSAVSKILHLLPENINIKHWGDSDFDGLRIAAIINKIRHVKLWRCNLPELIRHISILLPLSLEKHMKATSFIIRNADFPFVDELKFTIENGWLEQENWRK